MSQCELRERTSDRTELAVGDPRIDILQLHENHAAGLLTSQNRQQVIRHLAASAVTLLFGATHNRGMRHIGPMRYHPYDLKCNACI